MLNKGDHELTERALFEASQAFVRAIPILEEQGEAGVESLMQDEKRLEDIARQMNEVGPKEEWKPDDVKSILHEISRDNADIFSCPSTFEYEICPPNLFLIRPPMVFAWRALSVDRF